MAKTTDIPPDPYPDSSPVVAEVRAERRRLSEQFQNDPRRLGEYLASLQGTFPGKVVDLRRSQDRGQSAA